jgi:hypothetical protein
MKADHINPCRVCAALLLTFAREPTDDELRALHDIISSAVAALAHDDALLAAQSPAHGVLAQSPEPDALAYAIGLAQGIHAKHFAEVTQWRPLPDLMGVLTQIDNMTSGLVQPQPLVPAADVQDFDAWQQNPYTKVLQKSIAEDYVPKAAQGYELDAAPELARAESLHLNTGMPWHQAEEAALSEAGIWDAEIDELIGECADLGMDSLITDKDELRRFARAVLVHGQDLLREKAEVVTGRNRRPPTTTEGSTMGRVELNEGSYAFVLAQVALLNCEVAGMQAENTHRLSCGNSVAYGADEFTDVRQQYEALIGSNEILNMART